MKKVTNSLMREGVREVCPKCGPDFIELVGVVSFDEKIAKYRCGNCGRNWIGKRFRE